MVNWMQVASLSLLLSGVSSPLRAEPLGVSIEIGAGLNTCQDNGDFSCADFNAGGHFDLSVGYRFFPYFGVTLDLNYGWFSHQDDAFTLHTANLLPSFKLYKAFGKLEGEVGLGIGYAHHSIRGDDIDEALKRTATTVAAVKLGLGLRYRITPSFSTTLGARYVHTGQMNSCGESELPVNCEDVDGPGLLQIGVYAGYDF